MNKYLDKYFGGFFAVIGITTGVIFFLTYKAYSIFMSTMGWIDDEDTHK